MPRMTTVPLLAVLICGLSASPIAAETLSPFAGLPGAPRDVCRPIAESKLREHGLTFEQLSSTSWVEHKADSDRSAITGYALWARPSGCASGSLVIDFHRDCGVKQVYTRGGCRVDGITGY